ncbi:MAG: hypothetical protein AB7P33_09870 [Dehalococcoidia bacterium]
MSLGGSNVPDVTVIGDLEKEVLMEEVTPLGGGYETHASVGVKKLAPVVFEAPYSTTAGDLAVVGDTAGVGATLAVIVTIGGTKTVSFSSVVTKITRSPGRGKLTPYRLTVQPTGTITEA